MRNIYLVGFMGTGKSAVGKALSERTRAFFIDLDALIEEREKRSIADIFSQEGEPRFRKLEKMALEEISSKTDIVAACGGGIVLDAENIKIMRDTGVMVCLSARPEVIFERVMDYEHRPLLNVADKKKKIAEILDKRDSFYKQADIFIDTSDLKVNEVVSKILEHINNE